ncbi:hypothetical protein M758_UG175000 [Ceratodon purpureus]|nr:hypothetical protein M758_UG175000 [Ceratodon purpureus]
MSLRTCQHLTGSVILAVYGMTLSFTDNAIIVSALFFKTCRASMSAAAVGATVPTGGSTILQRSSLFIIFRNLKLQTEQFGIPSSLLASLMKESFEAISTTPRLDLLLLVNRIALFLV